MVKRALTSYDTVCWLDRLSFAQEMRESQLYTVVNTSEKPVPPARALPHAQPAQEAHLFAPWLGVHGNGPDRRIAPDHCWSVVNQEPDNRKRDVGHSSVSPSENGRSFAAKPLSIVLHAVAYATRRPENRAVALLLTSLWRHRALGRVGEPIHTHRPAFPNRFLWLVAPFSEVVASVQAGQEAPFFCDPINRGANLCEAIMQFES